MFAQHETDEGFDTIITCVIVIVLVTFSYSCAHGIFQLPARKAEFLSVLRRKTGADPSSAGEDSARSRSPVE